MPIVVRGKVLHEWPVNEHGFCSLADFDPDKDYLPQKLGLQNYLNMRGVRGITHKDFAKFIGVSKAKVTRWCEGTAQPTPAEFRMILRFLNITALQITLRPTEWPKHWQADGFD